VTSVTGASRFLIGLVTCFATHDGIPAVARVAWRRASVSHTERCKVSISSNRRP
jgi:hypothetical protein